MDLLEHQGKALLRDFDVAVPDGIVAVDADGAAEAASTLGGKVAIKAQVRVGGRGKAGGIKLAEGPEEARAHAAEILGMSIKGHEVRSVLVERATEDIAAEYYFSLMLDRDGGGYLSICSAQGGVDIEEVAAKDPSAIVKIPIDPMLGFKDYHARALASLAGLADEAKEQFPQLASRLFEAFSSLDAELVEINPLVLTGEGALVALDSKVAVDDNAFFRHASFEDMRDTFAVDPQERMAKEKGLNYVKIGGSVGVIGNGAGLVMSTLDLVANAGGKAANFLDVGGGAGADVVAAALEVVSSDPEVKSILINIFGGITRCDQVAKGIVEALGRIDLNVPLVIRLDGTNASEGREILASLGDHGGKLVSVETMEEAAARSAELARA
jgi:succinyl-CoA synthetase beta subunit